jgi:hypothetical protein
MTEIPDLTGPRLFSDTADPAQCLGLPSPGARLTYGDAPVRASATQAAQDTAKGGPPHIVLTAITTFATAADATDFVAHQSPIWQSCQATPVTTNPDDNAMTWTADSVAQHGPSLTAITRPQGSSASCQRALTAVQNAVIDVQACRVGATDQAEAITAAISQRITG